MLVWCLVVVKSNHRDYFWKAFYYCDICFVVTCQRRIDYRADYNPRRAPWSVDGTQPWWRVKNAIKELNCRGKALINKFSMWNENFHDLDFNPPLSQLAQPRDRVLLQHLPHDLMPHTSNVQDDSLAAAPSRHDHVLAGDRVRRLVQRVESDVWQWVRTRPAPQSCQIFLQCYNDGGKYVCKLEKKIKIVLSWLSYEIDGGVGSVMIPPEFDQWGEFVGQQYQGGCYPARLKFCQQKH